MQLDDINLRTSDTKFYARYAIVCVIVQKFTNDIQLMSYEDIIRQEMKSILLKWPDFELYAMSIPTNKQYYFKETIDSTTKEKRINANWQGYYKGRTLLEDLSSYFNIYHH